MTEQEKTPERALWELRTERTKLKVELSALDRTIDRLVGEADAWHPLDPPTLEDTPIAPRVEEPDEPQADPFVGVLARSAAAGQAEVDAEIERRGLTPAFSAGEDAARRASNQGARTLKAELEADVLEDTAESYRETARALAKLGTVEGPGGDVPSADGLASADPAPLSETRPEGEGQAKSWPRAEAEARPPTASQADRADDAQLKRLGRALARALAREWNV